MPGMRAHSDDGFTIAEVVISAAILFFVLTAILGLVGATQRMSISAKERSILTDATAHEIDRVRSYPFTKIEYTSTPGGLVVSNRVVDYNGVDVPVKITIKSYPDARGIIYLKEITIRASCTINGKTFTQTAVVSIKNPANDRTAATIVDPDAPEVEWVTPTQSDMRVHDQEYEDGTPIVLRVNVTSPNDKIKSVGFYVGDKPVKDRADAYGIQALWPSTGHTYPTMPVSSGTFETKWDTSDTSSVGQGFQTVKVLAWDDTMPGRSATGSMDFFVDNKAPSSCGTVTANALTSRSLNLQFPAAIHGAYSWASRYSFKLYKQDMSGSDSPPPSGYITPPTESQLSFSGSLREMVGHAEPQSVQVTTDPFSRYWVEVFAGSPRNPGTENAGTPLAPVVSRPELYSEATTRTSTCYSYIKNSNPNKGAYYTVTTYLSKPTFPCDSTSLTYQFKLASSTTWSTFTPSSATISDAGTTQKLVFNKFESGANKLNPYWFRVVVNARPLGWRGPATAEAYPTNAVGPASTAGGTTVQIYPDWTK